MRRLRIVALASAAAFVFTSVAVTAAAPGTTSTSGTSKAKKVLAQKAKKARKAKAKKATARRTVTRAAAALQIPFTAGQKSGSAANMELVGQHALGGRGFNADVWVHENHAYVGRWGFTDWAQGSKERFCPEGEDGGVAVVNVTNPANPVWVSTLPKPRGTSVEDVVVFTAPYGPMAGRDIAAVGVQVCGGDRTDASFARGLKLYDVTDPARPVEIDPGTVDVNTGCCTRGLHELEVEHNDDLDRTFVFASVPASEYPDDSSPTGRRDRQGKGDFRLIDITDPENAVEVSNWGVLANNMPGLPEGQGCDPDPIFGHSVEPSADGKRAFVAYWDSGFIELNVTNPSTPLFVKRAAYQPDEDGDAHSSMFDDERNLLFTADEDFCPHSGPGIETGWGYLRIWDWGATPTQPPVQIGEYRTPNSVKATGVASGDYTIHNPMLMETDVYISWYSDGVRVVNAANPRAPEEVAHFVPPASLNPVKPPQRGVLSQTPQVWGVYVDMLDPARASLGGKCVTGQTTDSCLVFASDMNSGLWILRRTD